MASTPLKYQKVDPSLTNTDFSTEYAILKTIASLEEYHRDGGQSPSIKNSPPTYSPRDFTTLFERHVKHPEVYVETLKEGFWELDRPAGMIAKRAYMLDLGTTCTPLAIPYFLLVLNSETRDFRIFDSHEKADHMRVLRGLPPQKGRAAKKAERLQELLHLIQVGAIKLHDAAYKKIIRSLGTGF